MSVPNVFPVQHEFMVLLTIVIARALLECLGRLRDQEMDED